MRGRRASGTERVSRDRFNLKPAVLRDRIDRAPASVLQDFGIDWRIGLKEAWEIVGHDVAVQGNLDPVALFAPKDVLRRKVHDILKRTGDRPGFIFNLGHGILPETPVEGVRAFTDAARALGA